MLSSCISEINETTLAWSTISFSHAANINSLGIDQAAAAKVTVIGGLPVSVLCSVIFDPVNLTTNPASVS
jgi:hypothetical protein